MEKEIEFWVWKLFSDISQLRWHATVSWPMQTQSEFRRFVRVLSSNKISSKAPLLVWESTRWRWVRYHHEHNMDHCKDRWVSVDIKAFLFFSSFFIGEISHHWGFFNCSKCGLYLTRSKHSIMRVNWGFSTEKPKDCFYENKLNNLTAWINNENTGTHPV